MTLISRCGIDNEIMIELKPPVAPAAAGSPQTCNLVMTAVYQMLIHRWRSNHGAREG